MPNVNDVVEQELASVEKDFYQMMVPRWTPSHVGVKGNKRAD
jgi:hypothetical protein